MPKSLFVTSTAKAACKYLVLIAERTDDEALSNTCTETITRLCESFDIAVFGSLPDHSNRSIPRGITIPGCLGTDV